MLGYELTGKKADFFTFRHTGYPTWSRKRAAGADTNIRTVEKHYFNVQRTRTAAMLGGGSCRSWSSGPPRRSSPPNAPSRIGPCSREPVHSTALNHCRRA